MTQKEKEYRPLWKHKVFTLAFTFNDQVTWAIQTPVSITVNSQLGPSFGACLVHLLKKKELLRNLRQFS